jgi:hypothetical protein
VKPRPAGRVDKRIIVRQGEPARAVRRRNPPQGLADLFARVIIAEPRGGILEDEEVRTMCDRSTEVKQDAFEG